MDNEYKEGGYTSILISHNRLKNADIEEMLEGGLLVSIESQEDHVTASLRGFIEDKHHFVFPGFSGNYLRSNRTSLFLITS
jgi:hypothetical protein